MDRRPARVSEEHVYMRVQWALKVWPGGAVCRASWRYDTSLWLDLSRSFVVSLLEMNVTSSDLGLLCPDFRVYVSFPVY